MFRYKGRDLDPSKIGQELTVEAHMTLGWINSTYEWNWAAAEKEYKRAIELNPQHGLSHSRFGVYLSALGRVDETLERQRRAQELEPLSSTSRIDEDSRSGSELRTDASVPRVGVRAAGEYEEAIAELQKGLNLSGEESEFAGALGHAYAISGKRGEAEQLLATLQEQSRGQYVAPFDIALIHLGLGSKSSTVEWLEKTYEDRSTWLTWIKVDPRFERHSGRTALPRPVAAHEDP